MGTTPFRFSLRMEYSVWIRLFPAIFLKFFKKIFKKPGRELLREFPPPERLQKAGISTAKIEYCNVILVILVKEGLPA